MSLTAGNIQTYTVPLTVLPSGQSCGMQVFLTTDSGGINVAAYSSVVPFSSTGSQINVAASLVAPAAGTYYVFVTIYMNGIAIADVAQGSVSVVAGILLPPTYGNISAISTPWYGQSSDRTLVFTFTITNPNPVPITVNIQLLATGVLYINVSGNLVSMGTTIHASGSNPPITIPANTSYTVQWNGNSTSSGPDLLIAYPVFVGNPMYGGQYYPGVYAWTAYLQDDKGGVSASFSFST